MRVVEIPREGFTEYWLTAVAPAGGDPAEIAERLYAEIGGALAARSILPVQEKLYGPLAARSLVLDARARRLEAAGADAQSPVTYLDGRGGDGALRGVQLWGVAPRPGSSIAVSPVAAPGGVRGREVRGPGFRLVHLAAVRGPGSGAVATQANDMFARADAALAALGLAFDQVPRTWIYLDRLLDGYADFNRVRTAFYGARGLTGRPDERPFPASIGIGGTSGGEACVMDLLAVDGPAARWEPVQRTSRQGAAFAYGSSFSRAAVVRLGSARTLFVSGTASIDAEGRSRHPGDAEAQLLETLLGVGALLDDAGAALGDVASATLFVKHPEILDVARRVLRQLGIPGFPFVPVVADVCRPELLVELEAVVPLRAEGRP